MHLPVYMAYLQPKGNYCLKILLGSELVMKREAVDKTLGLATTSRIHDDTPGCCLLLEWGRSPGKACACGPRSGSPPPSVLSAGTSFSKGSWPCTHPLLPRSACTPPPSFSTAWSWCFWPTESSTASSSAWEAAGRATVRSRRSVPPGSIVSFDRYDASLSSWRSECRDSEPHGSHLDEQQGWLDRDLRTFCPREINISVAQSWKHVPKFTKVSRKSIWSVALAPYDIP